MEHSGVVSEIQKMAASLTEWRRDIHRHPEPGFEEKRTAQKIREALSALPEPRVMAQTGLVYDFSGSGAAAEEEKELRIALRADMDALTMTETGESDWKSQNEGVHHGCGHDGHMACLIGAAQLLFAHRSQFSSKKHIRLLFQPAEEGPGGALPMIEEGCLEGVDEVYGMHNWRIGLGKIAVKPGAMMAHVTTFQIEIKGGGGHASSPHVTRDPIITAAQIILNLQTVVSRNLSPLETGVLSVTIVKAGERHNVIPDTAVLQGTIRDLDAKTFATIEERLRQIVKSTCEMNNSEYEILMPAPGDPSYPVLYNSEAETQHVLEAAAKVSSGLEATMETLPCLGAEDFAYFTEKVPGAFFFLGVMSDERPEKSGMCHNAAYNFNDNLIPRAVEMWVRLVEHRFGVTLE